MKSNVDSLPNGNKKRHVHIKIKHNSISIKNFTYPFFVGFLDPRFEMHNVKGDPMTHSRFLVLHIWILCMMISYWLSSSHEI